MISRRLRHGGCSLFYVAKYSEIGYNLLQSGQILPQDDDRLSGGWQALRKEYISMVFSSTVFLFLFLPVVIAVYYNPFVKARGFRNIVLLIASLFFYGWGEPVFVFLMILSIIVNWAFGLMVDSMRKKGSTNGMKAGMLLSVVYNLGLMFVFKYLTFVTKNIGYLFNNDSIVVNIALPIGISFFTFQLMSYVFDVYYDTANVQKNIMYVGLYVSMFPQLIAGPIVRYETVADEIENRVENKYDFAEGFGRFVVGLGKKILISNYVGKVADIAFATEGGMSVAMAWLGAIAYTLQIYFDFSGYSDMAIGLGRMFGFHFLENFNFPYISKSITEFWRRWHITLSTWFRDYVYIPLGGNRVSKGRNIWNIFVVWFLTGVWHGANWTFIGWGLLYFVLLMFEKLTGFHKKNGWYMHVYTMFFVILGWVLFRADSITAAVRYMGNMFGIGATGLADATFVECIKNSAVVFAAAVLFSFPVVKKVGVLLENKPVVKNVLASVCMVLVFVVSLLICIKATYNPFIYLNF